MKALIGWLKGWVDRLPAGSRKLKLTVLVIALVTGGAIWGLPVETYRTMTNSLEIVLGLYLTGNVAQKKVVAAKPDAPETEQ